MLVLSRRTSEELVLDGDIHITVLEIRGHQVRLGITAPGFVRILRGELLDPADEPQPHLTATARKCD
jgi:carbon storage regulator